MKCPLDVDVDLVMSERQGVEIDYCPTCRGVWLDRGELDKILDRAAEQGVGAPVPPGEGAGRSGPAAGRGAGQAAGHAAGHVSGEGGQGGGFEPIPGTPGYDLGGYGTPGYTSGRSTGGYGGYERDDDDRRRDDDDRSRYERPGYDPRRKKRKESWLGDLLDFG